MKNKSAFPSLRVRISPLSATISQTPLLNLASLNLKTSLSSGPLKITFGVAAAKLCPEWRLNAFLFVTFASVALFAEHLTVVSFGFSAF